VCADRERAIERAAAVAVDVVLLGELLHREEGLVFAVLQRAC
jgi:hypothetical protein